MFFFLLVLKGERGWTKTEQLSNRGKYQPPLRDLLHPGVLCELTGRFPAWDPSKALWGGLYYKLPSCKPSRTYITLYPSLSPMTPHVVECPAVSQAASQPHLEELMEIFPTALPFFGSEGRLHPYSFLYHPQTLPVSCSFSPLIWQQWKKLLLLFLYMPHACDIAHSFHVLDTPRISSQLQPFFQKPDHYSLCTPPWPVVSK